MNASDGSCVVVRSLLIGMVYVWMKKNILDLKQALGPAVDALHLDRVELTEETFGVIKAAIDILEKEFIEAAKKQASKPRR